MANKHQVLELLAKGLTPQEVAKKLNCSDAYVRATRRRASPDGAELARAWDRNRNQTERGRQRNRENQKRLYQRMTSTDEGREARRKYKRMINNGKPHLAVFPKAGVHYPASR